MIFTAEVIVVAWLAWQWKHRKTPWRDRPPFPVKATVQKVRSFVTRRRK